ncbi:hypothetical protein PFICI_05034 [Pestalotiopsis fici W106-1]|uniref:OTU domain-containing protein n=1 Tax=Pestalotiopsis fici (strain W106-1 / CGMCC3.15140) TaxID=1229662 RepID=W3XAN7_PESFW|nr:uncharacterized protein PFICI_05034 [Pestalotiopsis fici W106-1]ETS83158.1 hypothetical protein PFICI_05034 [Pestalotiopsis fici W106-1]
MSSEGGTTGGIARKRTSDEAGLELLHPQPKRPYTPTPLAQLNHERQVLDIAGLAAGDYIRNKLLQKPSSPELPSFMLQSQPDPAEYDLSSSELHRGSPDYSPDSPIYQPGAPIHQDTMSPSLSEVPSSQIISLDEFEDLQHQRKSQDMQDNIKALIEELKAHHGGKHPSEFVSFLQKNVEENGVHMETKDAAVSNDVSTQTLIFSAKRQKSGEPAIATTPLTANRFAHTGQRRSSILTQSNMLVSPITASPSMSDCQFSDLVSKRAGNDSKQTPRSLLSFSRVCINAAIEPDDNNAMDAFQTTATPESRSVTTETDEPDWVTIYNKELETIRMKNPFVTGKGVIIVKTSLRHQPKPFNQRQTHRVTPLARKSPQQSSRDKDNSHRTATRKTPAVAPMSNIISLDSDDEESPTDFNPWRVGGAGRQGSDAPGSHRTPGRQIMPATTAARSPQHSTHILHNEGAVDGAHSYGNYDAYGHPNSESSMDSYGKDSYISHDALIEGGDEWQLDAMNDFRQQEIREDSPGFYELSNHMSVPATNRLLRFQNRSSSVGEVPSPLAGHRLKFQKFLVEGRNKNLYNTEKAIQQALDGVYGAVLTVDEDTAILDEWCPSNRPDQYCVMKGFPLVESVEFIVQHNHTVPAGDCYWRSVSFCLYGSGDHWNLVKSEHLAYVKHVLSQPGHARHQLYAEKLNKKFFNTSSADSMGNGLDLFQANLYQVLHMAHSWTPALMQQVTADLYNICLIVFTCEKTLEGDPIITETAVRGAYNSRHIFMQFVDNNHFKPMCPNEFKSSEFRYPRVDVDKTAKFTRAPKATSTKSTLQHPWRNDFTKEVPAPVPRIWNYDMAQLSRYMGSK